MTAAGSEVVTVGARERRSAARRKELSSFLRAARERVKPAEHGLAVGARRRAPGLLREEVAQLAAISSSWYSWLEQGRHIQVSGQVLASVADVLRLSPAERDHVFVLAGHTPPGAAQARGSADSVADRALRRMVHQLRDAPAYLVDARWDIVEWNEAATVLFGLPLHEVPRAERNALRFALLGTHAPLRFLDPVGSAHVHVARFRADTTALIGEPEFEEQIESLLRDSSLFRRLWPLREVHRRGPGPLSYRHDALGPLRFDFVPTTADHGSGLRLHSFLPVRADL
ncbi:helix-turn-helix transcriptional regulator [Pseudonocardia sp. ICBG1293]|uniref:helix-turn-helix transcriptional regulator n=1 Tax=Pseudonocardia sp. ICBG1293 TaxID=2844382 RepID=UPI001CD03F94|nr:helix-turn-helix transcriptional regulator [Pseudonocardia sp. ICBG1293]